MSSKPPPSPPKSHSLESVSVPPSPSPSPPFLNPSTPSVNVKTVRSAEKLLISHNLRRLHMSSTDNLAQDMPSLLSRRPSVDAAIIASTGDQDQLNGTLEYHLRSMSFASYLTDHPSHIGQPSFDEQTLVDALSPPHEQPIHDPHPSSESSSGFDQPAPSPSSDSQSSEQPQAESPRCLALPPSGSSFDSTHSPTSSPIDKPSSSLASESNSPRPLSSSTSSTSSVTSSPS